MGLTNTFYNAVNSGDLVMIRIMMKNSLLADPTFTQFNEMEKAAGLLPHLYVEHDGKPLNMDKKSWNDDYMNELMVQVIDNFSRERVKHLKAVVRELHPALETLNTGVNKIDKDNISGKQAGQNGKRNCQGQNRQDQTHGNYRGVKIAAGTVAGAVIGGVVASYLSSPVFGGVVIGAMVGGTAAFVITNKGE